MSKEAEIGILTVVVLKARNLIDKHSFYKQDVFAQVALNGTSKDTHVDFKGGQHPVWDAELRFPIMKAASDKTRKLEVSCFSKERRSDDLLGKGSVDISDTLKTGEFDDWVSLSIDGTVRGDVYLEMTYFSSGPAPAVSSSLTVPSGQASTRHPSKLSPSERLYRSPQPNPPQSTRNANRRPPNPTPVERPIRPASHSPPQVKNSPLPPLPEPQPGQTAVPGMLLPGGATRSNPRGSSPDPRAPPSFLRPGNGNAAVPTSRSPDHSHRSSTSPSNYELPRQPSPSDGVRPYTGSLDSNPYLSNPTPFS
ncbi:hypothetical protein P691DRAFT_52960 [Macrolepiota fuliginosa MF-IS2]|uniref:C2 domain-containing protein n=1 Tax=Macrolepiota fuliginosa MF-IS2 TaxID=1400762 RepID=A0A9P5XEG2_9AGAR|nr:hypothetical protein P691DRAFT_52960 [Macrolepiota fuliginosa MF-IS2]